MMSRLSNNDSFVYAEMFSVLNLIIFIALIQWVLQIIIIQRRFILL